MFSTKGQEVKTGGGVSKSFQPGVVYAHIREANVRTAKSGKKMLELFLEGPDLENFEGWPINKDNPDGPKYTGQTAKVSATVYTDRFNENDVIKNELMYKLTIVASELGLRNEIDSINADTLEEWIDKAVSLLKGLNLYWFLKGTEEEYNGKTIVKLSLPKFKFCSVDEAKLDKFDKNNQYHYKAITSTSVKSFEPANTDFDM